jgi:hypothetical protein
MVSVIMLSVIMLSVMAPILCMSMVLITIVIENNSYSAAAKILKYL